MVKRLAVLSVLCLLVAGIVWAADSSRLTISPAEMKDGETKTLVDGDNTITVKRNGDSVDIRIEGAGHTRNITVSSGDGNIRVERLGGVAFENGFVLGPDSPRFRIERFNADRMPKIEGLPRIERERTAQTWFVCPKDHTMLRVPADKKDGTFKCPVDGTTMEQRKGRGFAFFFDDREFRSDDM